MVIAAKSAGDEGRVARDDVRENKGRGGGCRPYAVPINHGEDFTLPLNVMGA